MMAMAQLLNIRMPGSYEVTFPPINPDMPPVDVPGKGPGQSGMNLETVHIIIIQTTFMPPCHPKSCDKYLPFFSIE